ncbi:MAG: hypothetical protein EAZ53_06175 [Bacteroidetes bacterium]|nr:MAG: hypothetical protein EAZ53_06175 [Bacteroidota bacterium]
MKPFLIKLTLLFPIILFSQETIKCNLEKFEIYKTDFILFSEGKNSTLQFGSIWKDNNPINSYFKKNHLIVEVNNILISKKSKGKIKLQNDTLFLEALCLKNKIKNTYSLRYKISNISKFDFREILFVKKLN